MDRPSPAVQDYLKAIYQLDEQAEVGRAGDHFPGRRGARRDHRLGEQHAQEARRPRIRGARSSARAWSSPTRAAQAALEVIRHHRLLETYLATRLGMSWDEVHREAEVLEHHVSEALADRIAEALGHPERDPHGHPIPTSAGQVRDMPSRRPLRAGRGLRRRSSGRVDDRDDALLRFLAERGLVPDARVEVLGHSPFGGPISVRVGEPGGRCPTRGRARGARGNEQGPTVVRARSQDRRPPSGASRHQEVHCARTDPLRRGSSRCRALGLAACGDDDAPTADATTPRATAPRRLRRRPTPDRDHDGAPRPRRGPRSRSTPTRAAPWRSPRRPSPPSPGGHDHADERRLPYRTTSRSTGRRRHRALRARSTAAARPS